MSNEMYELWTDGACSGNPGPMGVGIMLLNDSNEILRQWSVHLGEGTNNIAELSAILLGLRYCELKAIRQVTVMTDSQYAIGVLSKGWKAKANIELIQKIKTAMENFKECQFEHVKGHSGNINNDHVDRLATKAVNGVVYDSEQ